MSFLMSLAGIYPSSSTITTEWECTLLPFTSALWCQYSYESHKFR